MPRGVGSSKRAVGVPSAGVPTVGPDLLTAASEVLGTRTKKDPVTAALRAAVATAAQRRELEMIRVVHDRRLEHVR